MTEYSAPSIAVFDVYGTLLHWEHTLEEMALEAGKAATVILSSSVDLSKAADVGEITFEEYSRHMAERWGLPGFAERIIGGLATIHETYSLAMDFYEAGTELVLATNVSQGALRMSFEQGVLPPLDCFSRIFQSCKLGVAKPDQAFYSHIIAQTQAAPEAHAFFDDSTANLEGARRLGMQAEHVDPTNIEGSVQHIRRRHLPHTLVA